MELQSHNDALANSLRRSFVPTRTQTIVYLIFGLLLLVVLNIGSLWSYFNNSVGVSTETANSIIDDKVSRFSDFTGNLFQGRLAPMLFWAFLGVLTYMIIWVIQNTATNVRNDLVARDYKHPLPLSMDKYWRSVGAHKVYLVCSFIFLGTLIYMAVNYWLPILAKVFYAAISDWRLSESLWRLVYSIFITAFLLYFVLTILRIARNAWRSVNQNL